jgi:hypothetical protein
MVSICDSNFILYFSIKRDRPAYFIPDDKESVERLKSIVQRPNLV